MVFWLRESLARLQSERSTVVGGSDDGRGHDRHMPVVLRMHVQPASAEIRSSS
jgi:hypothetical protein